MKIGEAKTLYSNRVGRLRSRRDDLLKKKNAAEATGDTELIKAARDEFNRVDRQYKNVSRLMDEFNTYTQSLYEKEAAKKKDPIAEAAEEGAKCLEVARRISKGAKVPPEDVQRLMNYNRQLYMMAMMMAVMDKKKSDEEYDSLWEEESEDSAVSAEQTVDNTDCDMEIPASVMADTPSEGE